MKKRFYDLLIKLVSVKGLFAIVSMISFYVNPSEYTFYMNVVCVSLLVVGREYDKLLEVIKIIKSR